MKTDASFVQNCQKPTFLTFKTNENRRFIRFKTEDKRRFLRFQTNKTPPTVPTFKYRRKMDRNDQKNVRALIGFGKEKPTKTDDFLRLRFKTDEN